MTKVKSGKCSLNEKKVCLVSRKGEEVYENTGVEPALRNYRWRIKSNYFMFAVCTKLTLSVKGTYIKTGLLSEMRTPALRQTYLAQHLSALPRSVLVEV